MSIKKSEKELVASLTDAQLALYEELEARGEHVYRVEAKTKSANSLSVAPEGEDKESQKVLDLKLISTMGTKSCASAEMLVKQILSLSAFGNDPDEIVDRVNRAFSMINNINPQDDIEAMLATQMVATQIMSMDCAKTVMSDTVTFEGKQLNLNYANRLMKTFTSQVAALDKHRGKAQQKVTVEHVHVSDGGQAIIGSVEGGRGGQ